MSEELLKENAIVQFFNKANCCYSLLLVQYAIMPVACTEAWNYSVLVSTDFVPIVAPPGSTIIIIMLKVNA